MIVASMRCCNRWRRSSSPLVSSPIFGKSNLTPEQVEGFKADIKGRVPLGRIGHVDEMAKAALFLAADATFSTGAELLAGGGLVDL